MHLPLQFIENFFKPHTSHLQNVHAKACDSIVPLVNERFRRRLENVSVAIFSIPSRLDESDQCISGVQGYGKIYIKIPRACELEDAGYPNKYKGTLAHEVAHALRETRQPYHNLADMLVHEGLALRLDLAASREPSHAFPHGKEYEFLPSYKLYLGIQPHLQTPFHSTDPWFTGAPPPGLPLAAGYIVGDLLVREYMEITGKPASDLLSTPTASFFECAGQRLEEKARRSDAYADILIQRALKSAPSLR